MRVYFLSEKRAALKLNGNYIGIIDLFERSVVLDTGDAVFAEIVPDGNLQPLNFILDDKFFSDPPDFVDVYLLGGGTGAESAGFHGGFGGATQCDALVYVKQYAPKNADAVTVAQTRFCGLLVTAFKQCGVKLCVEGEGVDLIPLPPAFSRCAFQEERAGGYPVLAVRGNGALAVLSEAGKLVFMNEAADYSFGDSLKITVPFHTCTAAKAECVFGYDGEKFTLAQSKTIETKPPQEDVMHFAFFESVLTRGNFGAYLTEELKAKSGALYRFLGDFCDVCVPTEKFYAAHGDLKAAGLVYPKTKNCYLVRYFAVETENGKISNIFEVD